METYARQHPSERDITFFKVVYRVCETKENKGCNMYVPLFLKSAFNDHLQSLHTKAVDAVVVVVQ
jgi:hypothetical protein